MTALSASRATRTVRFSLLEMVSTAETVWKGGVACIDLSTGLVKKGAASTTLIPIGKYAEDVVVASGGSVIVEMAREIVATWFGNSLSGDAILAANIGSLCYLVDDQTVALTSNSGARSVAGRVWKVDASKGVLVELLNTSAIEGLDSVPPNKMIAEAAPAFVSNDSVLASVVTGGIYSIPATSAASTVTLPATPVDGTWAIFVADGTANAHTVQYRDATGPANLTTALTASKRHQVMVTALGGKWFANAYVSP